MFVPATRTFVTSAISEPPCYKSRDCRALRGLDRVDRVAGGDREGDLHLAARVVPELRRERTDGVLGVVRHGEDLVGGAPVRAGAAREGDVAGAARADEDD